MRILISYARGALSIRRLPLARAMLHRFSGRVWWLLLIRFGDPKDVAQHLNYRERAQQIVNKKFNAVFGRAMAKAMATAK